MSHLDAMRDGVFRATFGKPSAINVNYRILEDGFRDARVDAVINSGQAVTLNAAGDVVPVLTNIKVYGLSRNNKNEFVDETRSIHYSGSGKIAIVVKGVVTLSKIVFTRSDGREVPFLPFEEAETYVPMAPLFVNAQGKLTMVGTGMELTRVGHVLTFSPDAMFPILEALIDC